MASSWSDVPTWSGDPVEFETFSTACAWYVKSLKESERKQAAARVWAKLQGPAKAVVRNLNPNDYEDEEGLTRLLGVLRSSPLQQLPVPDLFKRLDSWHMMKRSNGESIPQLLVREEDMFVQLQAALVRAREDRSIGSSSAEASEVARRGPPSTASQSPVTGGAGAREDARVPQASPPAPSHAMPAVKDFFEDELRGYRLLKAARLTNSERQNILTQTGNSTNFLKVRRALRTLFAEEEESRELSGYRKPRVWWQEDTGELWAEEDATWDAHDPGPTAWFAEEEDWQSNVWHADAWHGDDWHDGWEDESFHQADLPVDEGSMDPAEQQFREASVLANEATRTLAEAREAVRKVRQARGYFAPESSSGKGISGSPVHSNGRSVSWPGKSRPLGGKSSGKFGGCFICGQQGHGHRQCPDRFAKGKGSSSKGSFGGKGKGKSKFPQRSVQFHDLGHWCSPGIYVAEVSRGNRVILDTGASENAVGMESLKKFVDGSRVNYTVDVRDRPVFRFGNGEQQQAVSRVDMFDTSVGDVSFYVLGGSACSTPPLMGGKTLRALGATVNYEHDLLLYCRRGPNQKWFAVKMHPHPSNHVSIDLMEPALEMENPSVWFFSGAAVPSQLVVSEPQEKSIMMLSRSSTSSILSVQELAQKLKSFRERHLVDHGTMRCRRSSVPGLSMQQSAQAEDKAESACNLVSMHEMRSPSLISAKEGDARILQADGTTSKPHSTGDARDSEDDPRRISDREAGQWEADGAQRLAVAEGSDKYDGHQPHSPRVSAKDGTRSAAGSSEGHSRGEVQGCSKESGRGLVGRDPGSSFGISQGEWLGRSGPSCIPGGDQAEGYGKSQESLQGEGRVERVEDHSPDKLSGGDGSRQFGRGEEAERSSIREPEHSSPEAEGRIAALWSALKGLREKISACESLPHRDSSTLPSCGTNSHGLPQKGPSCAIQFQGGNQSYGNQSVWASHLKDSHFACEKSDCSKVVGEKDGLHLNSVEKQLPQPGPGGGKKKGVSPFTARKMAANVAMIGALVMTPMRTLMSQISQNVDFVEVACAPTSSLSTKMSDLGYSVQRINYREGYDLEKKAGTKLLGDFMRTAVPRHAWVSLPCTRLSSLNNLTQRDELEEAAFQKRQGRDLQRADEVAEACEPVLESGGDLSWEWPTSARKGWSSKAIKRLERMAKKYGKHLYWCHFHGCAYGLVFKNYPVQKSWTVATTDREVWLSLQKKCPGHQDHVHCRGQVAQASSYYPQEMVNAVVKSIIKTWTRQEERAGISLSQDVSKILFQCEESTEDSFGCPWEIENEEVRSYEQKMRSEDPSIMALTRNRFPAEAPSGRQLELIKAQMLRVHKAAGHPSMSTLQQLLRARQAPQWAIELAGQIKCPSCVEARQPPSHSVASLHETPGLFEIIGSDIFEFEHKHKKYKFMLVRDRASGLVMSELLKVYGGPDGESSWEPSSEDILRVFARWMMFNPCPKWILTDSATYFTSKLVQDFCERSGIGLLITPAEAHQMLGAEEGAIHVLKNTVARLLKEEEDMEVEMAFPLAAHGHNQTIGSSGFSPFQWTRGSTSPMENIPLGINPRRAFHGMLRLKEKARVAYEMESAKARLSKLNNTVSKKVPVFRPGQLVMLWRQKMKPGKTGGTWVGPVRMLLQEGNALWLASGATLIRARTLQVRECTRKEEMFSHLEGTAILKMPVTLESLLRNFTGRHFSDVSGDVPSLEQLQDDVQGAEVRVEPTINYRPDTWKFKQENGGRWMIRVHSLPRLALFTPKRIAALPVSEEFLTGRRVTKLKGLHKDAEAVEIEDDYKLSDEPNRSMQERWTGQTWFEMKKDTKFPEEKSKSRKVTKESKKRKAEDDVQPAEESAVEHPEVKDEVPSGSSAGNVLPHVPGISPLTTALRNVGPDTVDGIQKMRCPIHACQLPGGHSGPHEDGDGGKFTWSESLGRADLDDEAFEVDSESSEELRPAENNDNLFVDKGKKESVEAGIHEEKPKIHDGFYALEIPLAPSDIKYLTQNPEKAGIWMSKKMLEKSKEKRWQHLDMKQKQEFDIAQAKELSNVLSSRALRSLTLEEEATLNHASVMNMRWVLTTKSDGTAKARLVVLGFQMPHITEVATAAPTMARVSRSLLLVLCANKGYRLKAGDVTSAFLQTEASLESEKLTVWAPPELAVLFGADASNPVKALRISRAFYGLVQAPRHWFEDVTMKMKSMGWQTILADRCLFILYDDVTRDVIGAAGIHVDDFLICGDEDHPKFIKAEASLRETYRWGKWEQGEMEFAGTHIVQLADRSIRVDQRAYVEKWMDEIQLPKERLQQTKSALTPKEVSLLRGAIGSLAWKSSQTGPQYQADCGILLSEVPYRATINTVLKANKLIREVKRESHQSLLFPHWNRHWRDLVIVSWCDAGQQNRPDRSSTLGVLTGIAPKELLEGEECQVAIVNWKSGKTPRQCLGSNGAEVQAITEGEDITFKLRAMWTEIHGVQLTRESLYEEVKNGTKGALVMDTRGIYDAMTTNISSLHGLRSSRAGYELTLAVQQACHIQTILRWVNGLAQLGDCLTKFGERKVFLQFMANGQAWRLVHDEKFVAGRKVRKKELEAAVKEMENLFLSKLKLLAQQNRWPWDHTDEARSMGDESLEDPVRLVSLDKPYQVASSVAV